MSLASPLSLAPAAFLGVEQSATGRRWQARDYDERVAAALAQRHGLPDILARSLSARGVSLEEAEGFLSPRLRDLLPDPAVFKDMDKAAARFAQAVTSGESIAVFGDYDVDGATSSALLLRFARALGIELRLYVPDRIREGYGPNAEAMRLLAGEGVKLTICVDCGTTAHAPLAAARDAGMDVVVLDHHASEPVLPPAVAVVNPTASTKAALTAIWPRSASLIFSSSPPTAPCGWQGFIKMGCQNPTCCNGSIWWRWAPCAMSSSCTGLTALWWRRV